MTSLFNKRIPIHIFSIAILINSIGYASTPLQISHPASTKLGIVFTNQMESALYLLPRGESSKVQQLFSAPGCGEYFTVSPDDSSIGFKDIFADGTQAPALLNIASRKVTLLHSPVEQCGQVCFAADGEIAYSVEDSVYIQSGTACAAFSVGTYSNIVSLSADGQRLAFADGHGYISIMNLRTRQCRRVSVEGCMMPLWSPVGNKLCYSSLDGRLFVFDAGSAETFAIGSGADPAWTPDGASLVFVRKVVQDDSLVGSELWRSAYDGREMNRLTTAESLLPKDPSIGADGSVVLAAYNSRKVYTATLNQTSLKLNAPFEINSDNLFLSQIMTETPAPRNTAATPVFEVPYINQVYDTPPSDLGDAACAPTSAMMVLAYYKILPPWNLALSIPTRHVSPFGNYVLSTYFFHGRYFPGGGYGFMWSTSDPYHMMAAYYDYNGLTASRLDSPSLDTVISEVNAGYPYTLCNLLTSVGHVIVINGVGSKHGTVVANDPYGDKNIGQWPNYSGKDVEYDWPGYNNGNQNLNQAAWGVSVRYTPLARQDSIVDDLQFGDGFILNNAPPASMLLWQDLNTGFDGHFWYTHSRAQDTCTAEWLLPDTLADGNYEILAFIPSFSSRALGAGAATAARYKIFHITDPTNEATREDTVVIDQSKYANSWVSLGTYPFARGDSGYVELGDGSDTTGQIVEFDAIAWRYISPLLVRDNASIPARTELGQNYPNPFNPSTAISYQLSAVSQVSLKVYDVLGREVAVLVNEVEKPGRYEARFDGDKLPSGVYLYSLNAGGNVSTKKMILVK